MAVRSSGISPNCAASSTTNRVRNSGSCVRRSTAVSRVATHARSTARCGLAPRAAAAGPGLVLA